MSDLISRAETPTVLEKHQLSEEIPTNTPTDLISRQDALAEFIDDRDVFDIMESIESLPSADRPQWEWIPVSERLPIPPTFCLVTTDGSHGDVIDIALYMSDGWHKASEVLAWMPLPEPYREDGGDD